MARKTTPLTNTEVKQAKPREKEYTLSDGGGLSLRVRPSGAKSWFFNYYQPFTKKRLKYSLGEYPVIGIADARRKAEHSRKLLSDNIDPQEHKAEEASAKAMSNANTFQEISAKWLDIKRSTITSDHANKIWRSMELHLFPTIGKVLIDKVKALAVIKALEPLAARGALESVKRLTQRANEVMTYSVNTGLVEANPLTGISKAFHSPKKQHMPTLPPDQLPNFMKALNHANIRRITRCLVEWQLHTMVRPSEAAGACWDEIDIEKKLWSIPAERMKKKRPHVIPLTDQVLCLLDVVKPISGNSKYVFPSDRDLRKHSNSQTANMAIKRMGFSGTLVSHGLRALASTTLNERGFDPDVIEAALAHIDSNEVRAAYNRSDYLTRRREMMAWWSDFIERASTGNMSISAMEKLPRA